MNDTLASFVSRVQSDKHWIPDDSLLSNLLTHVERDININQEQNVNKEIQADSVLVECLIALSYFVVKEDDDSRQRIKVEAILTECISGNYELLAVFIERLKPMLIKPDNSNVTSSGRRKIENIVTGLKPRLGFEGNFEDEIWTNWRNRGGPRSVGLFYTILKHLRQKDISPNLWWISAGILNMMDDVTQGVENVRLYGVLLLQRFLQTIVDSDENNMFSFSSTGLYKVYEPILTSMLYYLPPSTDPLETLRIWKHVYPTLDLLFQVESNGNRSVYLSKLGSMFSENILQLTIPRIGTDHVNLSAWIITYCQQLVSVLSVNTTIYLQRILYVIGETYIRNPLITLNMALLEKSLELLMVSSKNCIPESVVNQKYDFLASILIAYEKSFIEGTLSKEFDVFCKDFLKTLKSIGCEYDNEFETLKKRKSLISLFE